MSDELTGTDEGLDELLSTDGDERVVQQSAAVGAAVGAIFGAGRGPIGAGIGAGVGSATGYVVGRAIAADRRRRRDADADPGIGPDAVNVPIGDDADESGGEGRDRSDVDRRNGAEDVDDGPIHIDIDVEDEADEADATDATDAADAADEPGADADGDDRADEPGADADGDDRADDDGRDDA